MEKLPDVVGMPQDEAIEVCRALGYEVEIIVTRPVKALPEYNPRAVRFSRISRDKGVLTVVYEDRGRGGGC